MLRRERWARDYRLRTRAEFLRVQCLGRRVHSRYFVAIVALCTPPGRIGITVSRRVGNAVVRNRIKRWVREFVRRQPAPRWLPPGCDVVVIAKGSAARVTRYDVIAADLAGLAKRW